MKDEDKYKEIDLIFESYLSPKKDKIKIRVKDVLKNFIFQSTDMNYSKVLFDSDLNMYKIDNDGKAIKVETKNFEAVVVNKE